MFPDLTTDPARLSRMILFDLDARTTAAIQRFVQWQAAVFGFAQNRLALAQGTRIAVLDFGTNAVEAIPANLTAGQQVNGIGFDGATVVWSTIAGRGRHDGDQRLRSRPAYRLPDRQGAGCEYQPDGERQYRRLVARGRAGGAHDHLPRSPRRRSSSGRTSATSRRRDMSIGYAFLNFWNANGGATIFGFPLTNEVVDPASQLTVQYFERSRFEYHPEAAGTPQVVQLTNVGRILTAGRTDPRNDNNSAFPPQPLVPAGTDRSYYVQTQHSIGGQFKKFFDQNGGTFVFGYPISEETIEANPTDGVAYTVQWFERARFEFHPEFTYTPNAIELGQLGRQLLLGQIGLYKPAMLAALHPETAPPRM